MQVFAVKRSGLPAAEHGRCPTLQALQFRVSPLNVRPKTDCWAWHRSAWLFPGLSCQIGSCSPICSPVLSWFSKAFLGLTKNPRGYKLLIFNRKRPLRILPRRPLNRLMVADGCPRADRLAEPINASAEGCELVRFFTERAVRRRPGSCNFCSFSGPSFLPRCPDLPAP